MKNAINFIISIAVACAAISCANFLNEKAGFDAENGGKIDNKNENISKNDFVYVQGGDFYFDSTFSNSTIFTRGADINIDNSENTTDWGTVSTNSSSTWNSVVCDASKNSITARPPASKNFSPNLNFSS